MSKMSEYHADMYDNQPQYYDRKIGKPYNTFLTDIHILVEFDHYEMIENNIRAYGDLEEAEQILKACLDSMTIEDGDRFSYRIDTISYKA